MLQRIRNCFGISKNNQLENEFEADETFVGSKDKNKNTNKKTKNGGSEKTPVVGMAERGSRVKAKVINNTTHETLSNELINYVKAGIKLYTDEYEWDVFTIIK